MKPKRINAQVHRNRVVQVDLDVVPDGDPDIVGSEWNPMILGELYHFIGYVIRRRGRGSYGQLRRQLPDMVLKLLKEKEARETKKK